VICRGDVPAVGCRGSETSRDDVRDTMSDPMTIPGFAGVRRPVRWSLVLSGIAVVSLVLAFLPGRTRIAPLIESDYCYLLIASDRMYDGFGPTAPLPVAPFQPWTWQADWGFLTQWPIGYPILISSVRWLFNFSVLQAFQWIAVVACATALVGWFVWVKRSVPSGVTGILLAALAAGCSVSTASLVNPSTDLLLVAFLPFALLFVTRAMEYLGGPPSGHPNPTLKRKRGVSVPAACAPGSDLFKARAGEDSTGTSVRASKRRAALWLCLAGLTAGGLFWIRYASVFVPLAVGLYLLIEWRRRRVHLPLIALFALCTAIPIVTLLIINNAFGMSGSVQAQLNLGHAARFDFSPDLLRRAWWNFTDFGFYDYHWYSHWVYALWPLGVILTAFMIRPIRRSMQSFVVAPGVALSALVATVMLIVLIGVTAAFGEKYDYVGLDRYYTPGKPLYFVLFIAPIMLIRRRVVRALLCVGLIVACSWIVRQEWHRPYRRWVTANREVTTYGQWSRCFTPNAEQLYRWLREHDALNLVVVSNFHEYVALETKIAALPIPEDIPTLDTWIDRICAARGVSDPRILFVLDPDNRWRDYWIPHPTEVIRTFGLTRRAETPATISAQVLEYIHGKRPIKPE